jgi:hypothetical protein
VLSWLLQMSPPVPEAMYDTLQRLGDRVTRDRRLRELIEAVEVLMAARLPVQGPEGWALYGKLQAVVGWVPERLRQLIKRQCAQLSPEKQML